MAELKTLVKEAGATAVLDAIHGKGAGAVRQNGVRVVTGDLALGTKVIGYTCAKAGGLADLWGALAAARAEAVEAAAWTVLAEAEAAEQGVVKVGDRVARTGSIYRGTVTGLRSGGEGLIVWTDLGDGEDLALSQRRREQRWQRADVTKIGESSLAERADAGLCGACGRIKDRSFAYGWCEECAGRYYEAAAD